MASQQHPTAPYDALSKAFHWTALVLVVAIYLLALAPGLVSGSVALHKSLGMVLLALMLARLAWRLTRVSPSWLFRNHTGIQVIVFAVHQGFYGMMIAIPLLGWAYLGYKGQTLHVWGMELPPLLIGSDRTMAALIYGLKKYVSYIALGFIGLHAAAALFHHYVRRDDVLRSMAPGAIPERPAPTTAGAD